VVFAENQGGLAGNEGGCRESLLASFQAFMGRIPTIPLLNSHLWAYFPQTQSIRSIHRQQAPGGLVKCGRDLAGTGQSPTTKENTAARTANVHPRREANVRARRGSRTAFKLFV
jgi:hypothetical protein